VIPKECKRLAEVDFPIAVVSKHSAREKSIRHGHPSTLHLWWARRPLAACRAMLLGLLLPDPCDPHCPSDFKTKSRDLLPKVQGKVGEKDKDLQQALLKFIGDFSNWDLSSNQTYLEVGRGLVKAAHPEETPLVVDPFAGGGSIPLEALRLGCEAFASDLNPVACLILKVMLEDIPRLGPELAEELRRVGRGIKEALEKELAEFYPTDPDGSKPIAYLWARTVRCESPNCGVEIPLVKSFWLCKKANRKRALRYRVISPSSSPFPAGGEGRFSGPTVEFEIFEPNNEGEVPQGTVARAKAKCLCCETVLSPDRVRAQLAAQRGGADVIFNKTGSRIGGARLLAVATLEPGGQGRHYRLPIAQDYDAVWKAVNYLDKISGKALANGLSLIPDEPTPSGGGSGAGRAFSVQKYGMMTFGDLFTPRQKLGLQAVASMIWQRTDVARSMALSLGKLVDLTNAICRWEPVAECPRNVFGAGRVKAAWDFAEGVAISSSSGSLEVCLQNLLDGMESVGTLPRVADTTIAAAQKLPLPDSSVSLWFTDPPYYDAYPYADLSDVFFVWFKRVLREEILMHDPFDPSNPLTPKALEIVQDETKTFEGRPKDKLFFEQVMAKAFAEGRRVLAEDGVCSVVFAHKTTEGWEALITGIVNGGLTVTSSWPIATEQGHRLRAQESAALRTSVHLVCRPRPDDAQTGDWGDVLRELPKRVGDWMERLQSEGIRGADLVFACIGPALEIFSRYSKVETAEGREVGLPEFLEKVWEVVGRTALEHVLGTAEAKARNSAAGALEEDARLTALFLWTLQSTNGESPSPPSPRPSPKGRGEMLDDSPSGRGGNKGDSPKGRGGEDEEGDEEDEEEEAPKKKKQGYSLIFDVVRRFAQPLGIHLPEWEGRVIETDKGIVRLLSVAERAKQLFGEEGTHIVAERLERSPAGPVQLMLFPERREAVTPTVKGRGARQKKKAGGYVSEETVRDRREATTLDRVHAAMLLQASGKANALRALLKAEIERSPDFLRLANALSALYPRVSEEKRLLDAMLLAIPR